MDNKYYKIYIAFVQLIDDIVSLDDVDVMRLWKEEYIDFWRLCRNLVHEECPEYSNNNTERTHTEYAILLFDREIRKELNATTDKEARNAIIINYISHIDKIPIADIVKENKLEEEEWDNAMANIDGLEEYIEEILWLAECHFDNLRNMIADYKLDANFIAKRVHRQESELISEDGEQDEKLRKPHKGGGKYITCPQQTLAIKVLLEQVGITPANTDKTKISAFATAIMGRNMDLEARNSPVYKAVRGENTEKDWAIIRELFEDVGLVEIAAKIK